jgi:uncharacterized membrane protein
MYFQQFMGLLVPIILLVLGLMTKFSNNDGWSSYKKNWLYLIITGTLLLIAEISRRV